MLFLMQNSAHLEPLSVLKRRKWHVLFTPRKKNENKKSIVP